MGIAIELLVLWYVKSFRGVVHTVREFNWSKICLEGCYTLFPLVIVVATRYFRAEVSNNVARAVCKIRYPQVLVNQVVFVTVEISPKSLRAVAYHICTLWGLLLV